MRHRLPNRGLVRSLLLCATMVAACDDSSMNPDGQAMRDGGVPRDLAQPAGCTVMAPTACPSPPLHYADVQPIFQARCISCHSDHSPRWPLTTYQHVADWYDQIHDDIRTCAMPPPSANVPITDEERVAILTWLLCGFPP